MQACRSSPRVRHGTGYKRKISRVRMGIGRLARVLAGHGEAVKSCDIPSAVDVLM